MPSSYWNVSVELIKTVDYDFKASSNYLIFEYFEEFSCVDENKAVDFGLLGYSLFEKNLVIYYRTLIWNVLSLVDD